MFTSKASTYSSTVESDMYDRVDVDTFLRVSDGKPRFVRLPPYGAIDSSGHADDSGPDSPVMAR